MAVFTLPNKSVYAAGRSLCLAIFTQKGISKNPGAAAFSWPAWHLDIHYPGNIQCSVKFTVNTATVEFLVSGISLDSVHDT